MNTEIKVSERDLTAYYRQIVPFGYMDVERAIEAAMEAGKDADWAAEQVTNWLNDVGGKIESIDPVYVVYDSILQEARNEIDQLISYDLCNDATNGEIYTYGNCLCTSYDYKEAAKEELITKLKEGGVIIEDLSEATQWFLSQLEISQENLQVN